MLLYVYRLLKKKLSLCHCEEQSDVAFSVLRKKTRLLHFIRNDRLVLVIARSRATWQSQGYGKRRDCFTAFAMTAFSTVVKDTNI